MEIVVGSRIRHKKNGLGTVEHINFETDVPHVRVHWVTHRRRRRHATLAMDVTHVKMTSLRLA